MRVIGALLICLAVANAVPTRDFSPAQRAKDLIAQMTLEEKISFLHGTNGPYTGTIAALPRLGIPEIRMEDGPQGFRSPDNLAGTSTAFPSGLNMAATFDPEAAFLWGDTMGVEFRNKGANVQLGPGLNIARVPVNGRNFEYLSGEDPFLGRRIAKRAVEGIQINKVIANAKHFINNNEETNRMAVSEDVDERTEFEIYMPPFQGAVEGGVLSVMCSYNKINGVWACENNETLNRDLKERLGFQGWVMSDWGATHTTELAANSGLDQQMPDDSFFGGALLAAVQQGRVAEVTIDEKVFRILSAFISSGAFDSPPVGDISANVTSDEHNAIARDLAARSTVLLKNEKNILPLNLAKMSRIAVIGDAGHKSPICAGGGSGHVVPAHIVTGFEGIQGHVDRSVSFSTKVKVTYTPSGATGDIINAAKAADVAIVFVATTSSEGSDRPNLSLSKEEDDLIYTVAAAQPNTIVVATTPGALLMPWTSKVSAILVPFMAGQEVGNAIADILFGEVAPTARLPLTMPNVENEVQFAPEEYPGLPVNEPLHASYAEKLLVGYRWYNAKKVNPNFCFGHGLTFTEFEYSNITAVPSGNNLFVSVAVTNTGSVTSAEIAQLYLTFPESAGEPPRQLKGFVKTIPLPPQSSTTIQFLVETQDLSIWSEEIHGWSKVTGKFTVEMGRSVCDIRALTSVQIV